MGIKKILGACGFRRYASVHKLLRSYPLLPIVDKRDRVAVSIILQCVPAGGPNCSIGRILKVFFFFYKK